TGWGACHVTHALYRVCLPSVFRRRGRFETRPKSLSPPGEGCGVSRGAARCALQGVIVGTAFHAVRCEFADTPPATALERGSRAVLLHGFVFAGIDVTLAP